MPEIKLNGSRKPWTKTKKKPRTFTSAGKPNYEQFIPFYKRDTENDSRYSSKRWRSLRMTVLGNDPTCPICMTLGRVNSAHHVDHVRLHDTDGIDFYDDRNLWGLCESCHATKSAMEANGIGTPHALNFGEAKAWWVEAVCDVKRRRM